MSVSKLEAFLARIYCDEQARAKFLANPRTEALRAGLSPTEIEALEQIDQVGLELFAVSLERKKHRHSVNPVRYASSSRCIRRGRQS